MSYLLTDAGHWLDELILEKPKNWLWIIIALLQIKVSDIQMKIKFSAKNKFQSEISKF